MGLDTVEIVMEVEETFGIEIPEDRAAEIRTVGDLYDFVLEARPQRIHQPSSGTCLSASTFYTLRRALIAETGLARRAVHPRARVDATLPRIGRRDLWRHLQTTTGLILPELHRPGWVIIACGTMVAATAMFVYWVLSDLGEGAFLFAGIALALMWLVAATFTERLAPIPALKQRRSVG